MSQDRKSDDDHVELTIAGTDRDRGIAIPAFGIEAFHEPSTSIASKAGTFPFHCSVFCGLGHRHMTGNRVVEGY
jgi:cytochrome c oxidase subunit II